MSLSVREAKELAWWAFLDEVGEPVTPCWREAGFVGSHMSATATGRPCDGDEHWRIIFFDARAKWGPNCVAARVWVDKQTGHCNVWVNEDYDPTPPDPLSLTSPGAKRQGME
ncbi:MAG TPA: hypothetical protein VEA69_12935 [Tepidisphaeraceae bacterium]|nr:hypothetical protein [Tepidisphaeraceae bacterium]